MSEVEVKYVRGASLQGYDGYCPIVGVDVYPQDNGNYLESRSETEIPSSDFIERPGFLVVHLGSIEDDYTVETAAYAINSSLVSLFSACDIPVDLLRVRTTVELSEYMKLYRSKYSHIIFIGHGSTDGISFLDKPKPIKGNELGGFLGADESDKSIQIISLCCHSGCESLSRNLSQSQNISEVLAPNSTFDMRWAVHFVTGYFLHLYVDNLNTKEAIKKASVNSGNVPMCIWVNGELIGTCAT